MSATTYSFAIDQAQALPPSIRFGTSTWTYPGWRGLIYNKEYKSDRAFKADSLGEYASFGLFRTVGIDHTFYTPPSPKTLDRYCTLVPENFQWISKVWERITIPKYPPHERYGAAANTVNEDFLNSKLFTDQITTIYDRPGVRERTGPFVFQFPTIAKEILSRDQFLRALESFLMRLPRVFRYATEVRNPEFLVPEYFQILNRANATHCFNHWFIMPRLKEQMKLAAAAGGLTAPFYVARILTPLGVSYEKAVKLFAPYNTIKRPNPEMREDVCRLAHRAIERAADAYIIVNNRCEGNSPMTIDSIVRMIQPSASTNSRSKQ